jgi:hypothetical protein
MVMLRMLLAWLCPLLSRLLSPGFGGAGGARLSAAQQQAVFMADYAFAFNDPDHSNAVIALTTLDEEGERPLRWWGWA